MEYKDYYKILGVSRSASTDEIRSAYRKLARKYHPDVSKEADAEARFKEVGEAYEVLKDEEKRATYDHLGSNWRQGQDFRPPPGWQQNNDFRGGAGRQGDFSDFFSSLFGGGHAGTGGFGGGFGGGFDPRSGGFQQQRRGQDQHSTLKISLDEAMNGAKRTITLQTPEGKRDLTVTIPKGVKAGQRIRLNGQGHPGISGAGDLLLEIEFLPHPHFKLDERNISITLPLAPWEAALGTTVNVPTPAGGSVELKIPPNSRAGRKMRLKGKGLPGTTQYPAGDFYVLLDIVLPPADSANAKAFYEKMAETLPFNPRSDW